MRVRLGGKYWTLRFAPNLKDYGDMVDPGRADGRLIRIGTWQGEADTLDTIIHEALHCSRPELDEAAVDATARDLSRLLWRVGYRRTCDKL
jgi:hypothetical protein